VRPSNVRRKVAREVRWGEKGRTGIKLVDVPLPHQERGACTGHLYGWSKGIWPQWVDVREVPGLIKELGFDHLDGDYVNELERKKKAHDKRKAKEREPMQVEEPAKVEEVEQ